MNPQLSATSAVIVIAVLLTLGYAIGCWIWPFRACHRCDGTGRKRSPTGRGIRYCRSCRGTGLKLRAGRWIYNQLTHLRKESRR